MKSLGGVAPSPKKVMTPDEKRQKETARKQLYRKQNPEQYAAEKKRIAEQQQKRRAQQSLIQDDTTFESICCCCVEFKSADKTKTIADCLTLGQIKKHCHRTKMTMELDKTFSICNDCKKSIKDNKIPPKAQRDLFQLSSFPESFFANIISKTNSPHPKLNKVEQFLLKLIIPFIRVGHCERGTQMKVRGNLILISADIARSLEKILPQSQNIIPVRFKRKLTYTGHYAAEYIDRRKVELYFNWFKQNNPLFADFSLDQGLVERFEQDTKTEADIIFKQSQSNPDAVPHEVVDEVDLLPDVEDEIEALQPDGLSDDEDDVNDNDPNEDEIPISQQHSTVMAGKYADVDAGTESETNKLASLIVHLEQQNVLGSQEVEDEVDLDHMTDEVSDFFMEDVGVEDEVWPEDVGGKLHIWKGDRWEVANKEPDELVEEAVLPNAYAARKHRKRVFDNIATTSVAPGEGGEFQNWKEDVFLEEKAFPHLSPTEQGGT